MQALSPLAAQPVPVDVCGTDPGTVCRWVYERSGSKVWAQLADWAIDRPLRIAVILIIGFVVSRVLQRSVNRFGAGAVARSERQMEESQRTRTPGMPTAPLSSRARQRASTLTSVLSSLVAGVVWVAVGLLVLGEIGITLGPLLAGAGVVGVVLAFGAQHVVADFLAGWFMLTEDQFGVGDVVDLGEVTGTVERVSLRVTTVRDVHGSLWHVPNSEIHRVANKSQLWSQAVIDIDVQYDTDLRQAQSLLQQVAEDLWHDATFTGGEIIDRPQVLGVEKLAADGVTLRLVVKTDPADQWAVARELRLRIKEAFAQAGIAVAAAPKPLVAPPAPSRDR